MNDLKSTLLLAPFLGVACFGVAWIAVGIFRAVTS